MKLAQLTIVLVALSLVVTSCAGAKKVQKRDSVTISGILQDAKCPLSKDQETKLKAFKPGGDRGAFRTMYEVFDEKQTAALKEAFGSSPGRGDGLERPRFLFFAVLFENAGCPLTPDQITKLKALPNERGAFQQMGDILTEQQSGLLQGMFNR